MDGPESVDTAYQLIWNRFPKAPRIIYYDNACHFYAYCMARNPMYFISTLFLIDALHWNNHLGICSCLNDRTKFDDNPSNRNLNSQSCEQLFARLRRCLGDRLSKMDPITALFVLLAFGLLLNISHKPKQVSACARLLVTMIY